MKTVTKEGIQIANRASIRCGRVSEMARRGCKKTSSCQFVGPLFSFAVNGK